MKPDNHPCIEYVTFKLKKGTNIEDFRKCSDELDTKFLVNEDGFLLRKLLLLHNGETWADLALWRDTAAANAAEAKFMKDPVTRAYGDLIDMDTLRMEHSNQISHFEKLRPIAN